MLLNHRETVVSTAWTISSTPGLWSDTTFSVKPSVSIYNFTPSLHLQTFHNPFSCFIFLQALISIYIAHILLNYFPILLPVVCWSLLTIVCKSRLLNIQEFCKLVVKLAVVGRVTPWKLTNATNWGLFFWSELVYQLTTALIKCKLYERIHFCFIRCCILSN